MMVEKASDGKRYPLPLCQGQFVVVRGTAAPRACIGALKLEFESRDWVLSQESEGKDLSLKVGWDLSMEAVI